MLPTSRLSGALNRRRNRPASRSFAARRVALRRNRIPASAMFSGSMAVPFYRRHISEYRCLWHIAGDTLDDILVAAAQLDDITIRIADEH